MDNKDLRALAVRTVKGSQTDAFYDPNDDFRELAEAVIQLLNENERLTDKLADEIMDNEDAQREDTARDRRLGRYEPLVDENDEPLT